MSFVDMVLGTIMIIMGIIIFVTGFVVSSTMTAIVVIACGLLFWDMRIDE